MTDDQVQKLTVGDRIKPGALTGTIVQAGALLVAIQCDIDVLHQRLDSIDRKITFFGEVVIAVLAMIVWIVSIRLANTRTG